MKILVYKDKAAIINEVIPAPKERVQKELSALKIVNAATGKIITTAKDIFKSQHLTGLAFEQERNNDSSIEHHTKRLSWVDSVVDFDNLTDAEFEALIECDCPGDSQYAHWMQNTSLPTDRTLRDAWVDVDADGTVTHDENKAREIIKQMLRGKIILKMEQKEVDQLLGEDTSSVDADIAAIAAKNQSLANVKGIENLIDFVKAI